MVDVNGAEIQKKLERTEKIKKLPDILKLNANKILNVLPSGFSEEEKKDMVKAMIYLAIKAYEEMPELRNCTPDSLIKAIMDAASLGMIPFSKMNECAIIPYGNTAQFQLMYRGIYKLAMNTGLYKDIRVDVVREGDRFYYEKGFEVKMKHIPALKPAKDRDIVLFYGIYETKDGGRNLVIMTKEDIDEHRDRYSKQYRRAKSNKNRENAIWEKEYEAMGLKTVLIKLLKYAPKTEKLVNQLALDKAIKREIAPEQKDFTAEAEKDFIEQRIIDSEGQELPGKDKCEDTDKSENKKDIKKVKKVLSKISKEELETIYSLGESLHLNKDKLTERILIKYQLKNIAELSKKDADDIKKSLEESIRQKEKEAEEIEHAYEEAEQQGLI
jgi:recombination protein RecT